MSEPIEYHLRVPHESPTPNLLELLERGFPERTESQLRSALADDAVTLDGEVVRRPGLVLRPGGHLRVKLTGVEQPSSFDDSYPDAHEFTRGDGWVLVDKPVGMPGGPPTDDPTHPFKYLADQLGLDRDAMTPIWPLPKRVGGPWLLAALPADARQLAEQFSSGTIQTTWRLLTPFVEPAQGSWTTADGQQLNYATVRRHKGLAELQVTPQFNFEDPTGFDPAGVILQTAAAHGTPVVGDRHRGGYAVQGPTRFRLSALYGDRSDLQISIPVDTNRETWWPEQRITPPETPEEPVDIDSGDFPLIDVSEDVLSAVEKGRPWIDIATGVQSMDNGDVVRIRSTQGREPGLFGLVDLDGPPAARLWTSDAWDVHEFPEAVAMRIDEAIGRRTEWYRDIATCDLFRIAHGEADGLPGLYIDRLGPLIRFTSTTGASHKIRDHALDNLTRFDDDVLIISADRIPKRAFSTDIAHPGGRYVDPSSTIFAREQRLKIPVQPRHLEFPGRLIACRAARRKIGEAVEKAESTDTEHWLHLAPPADGCLPAIANAGADVTVLVSNETQATLATDAWSANDGDDSDLTLRRFDAPIDVDDIAKFGTDCDSCLLDIDFPDVGLQKLIRATVGDDGVDRGLIYRGRTPETAHSSRNDSAGDFLEFLRDHSALDVEALELPGDIPTLPQLPEIAPVTIAWVQSAQL